MAVSGKRISRPDPTGRSKPSLAGAVVALLTMTIAAAAAGALFGLQVQTFVERSPRQPGGAAEVEASETKPAPVLPDEATMRSLPPVITNLAGPKRAWVRIEASIVLAGEPSADDERRAARIAEDITAFMQTVSASDIEGASGFQHLRADLKDRVRARSDGRVRDLVIHTFVVE